MPSGEADGQVRAAQSPGVLAWTGWGRAALPLAVEVAALAGLLGLGDLGQRRPAAVLLLGVACFAQAWLVWAARGAPLSPPVVVGVALLLRALLLPLAPALSSDVWRYLWEGRVAAAGFDPYRHPPADPALAALRDAGWERVDHREVPAVYPPLAMATMSLVARLPAPLALAAWKGVVTAADLALCWLLLRLAAAGGRPTHRVLWYAAHPLAALEVAGMGHLEPLGVAAVAATLLALLARPPRRAGAALAAALGALAKLVPFAAWPMWARQSGASLRFFGAAAGVVAVATLPLLQPGRGLPAGLVTYASRWEFAGPLHEPLWRLLAAADAPARVKHALDLTKEWTGLHEAWNRLYPQAYPQMLARLALGLGVVALVVVAVRWRDPLRGTAALFGGLLLLSPTLYPWYLLWVLPFAALGEGWRWRWAAAVAPVAYLPGAGLEWWPWLHALAWGPFLLFWWRDWRGARGERLAGGREETACAGA
jgi:hypothetical protein